MTGDVQSLPSPADTVIVAERAHLAVASTPFDVQALPEANGQVLSFVTDAWYELRDETWLGLRLPLVAASVRQPAGSYLDEAAWGNPELRLARRFTLILRTGVRLQLTLGGGVGIPLAEHDRSLMPNRALAIANAGEGLAEPELFTPGELPLTPFARLDYTSRGFRALALLKVPLLLRVSDADLPSTQSQPRAFGLSSLLALEGSYDFTRHLGMALASQWVVEVLPASEHVRSVPALQWLVRASPYYAMGERGSVLVDVQAPIGGALGGTTFALGVRAALRF
ncbi:MAG TPA: hypothetical protein VHM25_16490 [Polyangiaceae bacterium]|nr:hypothetical protein [Polyangiaceae bacterium]